MMKPEPFPPCTKRVHTFLMPYLMDNRGLHTRGVITEQLSNLLECSNSCLKMTGQRDFVLD